MAAIEIRIFCRAMKNFVKIVVQKKSGAMKNFSGKMPAKSFQSKSFVTKMYGTTLWPVAIPNRETDRVTILSGRNFVKIFLWKKSGARKIFSGKIPVKRLAHKRFRYKNVRPLLCPVAIPNHETDRVTILFGRNFVKLFLREKNPAQ